MFISNTPVRVDRLLLTDCACMNHRGTPPFRAALNGWYDCNARNTPFTELQLKAHSKPSSQVLGFRS